MKSACFTTSLPYDQLRAPQFESHALDTRLVQGSWSWQLCCSNGGASSGSSSSSSSRNNLKEARRGAGSQHVKGHEKTKAGVLASNGEGGEAFVPTLFLGDLFTPCNSLGLFRDHEDLDTLFVASPAQAPNQKHSVKRLRSKHLSSKPPSQEQPQQQQQPLALDQSAQLALRMATPIDGRRLFFVSNQSAEVIRQAQVLERYEHIMAKRAQVQAAQAPLFPSPSDVKDWVSGLGAWLQPGSGPQPPMLYPPPSQQPAPPPPHNAAPADSSSSSSSSRTPPASGTGSSSAEPATPPSPPHRAGLVKQPGGSPPSPQPPSPVLPAPGSSTPGGAFSFMGWLSTPASALSRVLEQDLGKLEEEAVIAEAQHLMLGDGGNPPLGSALVSFVRRFPLEAAFRVMSHRPQHFDLVVTGTDARLAKAAVGKQAMLDLHAGTDDKWLFKIKDDASFEGSESDEDMAVGSRTPIFTIPGVRLALKLQGGSPVHLSPTFLSITQLHTFAQTAKALAGRMWLSSRASQREQLRDRVEAVCVALAGNGTLASGVSGSGKARGGSGPDEDEDEEGFGDPPEAKQLLAELGEGRGGGALAPALPPATGLMGALNAVAVGAIACVGQAATTLADGMDRLLLASPLGNAACGVPKHLAVRVGYLEDTVAELAAENQKQSLWLQAAAHAQSQSQLQALEGQGGSAAAAAGCDKQGSGTHGPGAPAPAPAPSAAAAAAALPGESRSRADQPQQSSHAARTPSQGEHQPQPSLPPPLPPLPHQHQQHQPKAAPSLPPPSQQPLESQAGLGLVLQALWAVLHNTAAGDGKLAALLASNWLGTTKISASKQGQVSAMLAVQIKSQVAPAAPPPFPPPSASLDPTATLSSPPSSPTTTAPTSPASPPPATAPPAPAPAAAKPAFANSSSPAGTGSPKQQSAPQVPGTQQAGTEDGAAPTRGSKPPLPDEAARAECAPAGAGAHDFEPKGGSLDEHARALASSSRSAQHSHNRAQARKAHPYAPRALPTLQTHKFEVGVHIDLNDALGSDWDDSASEDFKEDKPEKGGEKGGKVRACEDADERGPASTSQRLEGRSSGDAAQANIAQGSPLQQEDLSQPAASPPAAEGSSRKKPCQPSITGKEAAFQGLLLMSDLGLQKDEDEQPWRAPPLAFANLGAILKEAERNRLRATNDIPRD